MPFKVFVFGPDKRIWELDKSSATAAHVLGRSCMQSFYEGAVLHGHRKRDWFGGGGFGSRTTAWVNGQEVCALVVTMSDAMTGVREVVTGGRGRDTVIQRHTQSGWETMPGL